MIDAPGRPARNALRADRHALADAREQRVECAAFRVETGLELRTMYSPQEIIASQLFRGPDADEKVAETADRWRLNLLAKGFSDVA